MAKEQRFNKPTRHTLGVLSGLITAFLGIAIGVNLHGESPWHVVSYASWPLVALAVFLDFASICILHFEVKGLIRERKGWEHWARGLVIVIPINIIAFFATMWSWSQRVLENFLHWLGGYVQWFDTGSLSHDASKDSGLVAYILVIVITNTIWFHAAYRGRARDGIAAARNGMDKVRHRQQ